METQHPFHPQHPLTILSGKALICDACGQSRRSILHCSLCNFSLDDRCAFLMPTTQNNPNNQIAQTTSHPHPFIPCDLKERHNIMCSGCERDITDSTVYVCLQCHFTMHKSCAEQAPPYRIKHPFHPPHSLLLSQTPHDEYGSICSACNGVYGGLTYRCVPCDFNLDTACALLQPTIKFELHHHPLAFFNKLKSFLRCISCECTKCTSPMFRCVLCQFSLHLHCVPTLPHTIKHECHCHPLKLTVTPIKDSPHDTEDSEYYCDACEEARQLLCPTYYCAECHYIAHVHCVVSEKDLPSLGTEVTQVAEIGEEYSNSEGMKNEDEDQEKAVILSAIAKIDEEIKALKEKLDELGKRRAYLLDFVA